MKKIFLLATILAITVVSCGEKKKGENKVIDSPVKEDVKPPPPPPSDTEEISNEIVLESDDNMRFSKKKIIVNGGQKVKLTLKHVGKMSKEIMGHNWVLLKKGTKLVEFGQKAGSAKDTEYIPADMKDAVIVHTKMIGGGEETTIEFDAPEPGEYDFLCSFPAHYAIMKGKFIVK